MTRAQRAGAKSDRPSLGAPAQAAQSACRERELATLQVATLRGMLTTTVARAIRQDDRRAADPKAERRWKARSETVDQLQGLAAEFTARGMVLELLEAHAGALLLLNVNREKRLTWHVIVMCLQLMRQEGK